LKVNYQYASPSMCLQKDGHTTLGLSPDLSRDERVSFLGKLKHPLIFRDAMLMLREIVISDGTQKKKERDEFFAWLNEEIEKRMKEHEKYLPGLRESIQDDLNKLIEKTNEKNLQIANLQHAKNQIKKELDEMSAWKDYDRLEKKFWNFLRFKSMDLWYVLDPVITVHPDQVSFEAFSVDESIYGCLSIEMDEFEMLKKSTLGTTNIDFSAKLAKEMKRFRTYSDVLLSVNPEGFTVDAGATFEYLEKKIDLPETWIKGFNQVSSAANLNGISLDLSCVDMYDLCSFLRRHKENKSPRYMKWILKKDEPIRIVFEPFGKEIVLKSIYKGDKDREEKIWGRRRWLVLEKLIPLAKSFQIKLLGFGMPQFIIADLGKMKMTIGFSSWTSNDWVKGTAFNIMSGFIGDGNYKEVYSLLKKERFMSIDDICATLNTKNKKDNISGIGSLLKRGEGYFDATKDLIRFRRLYSEPIPEELYKTTDMEYEVLKLIKTTLENFTIKFTEKDGFVFNNKYKLQNNPRAAVNTEIIIDEDGEINKLKCSCTKFNKGPRNISSPCSHILALYMISIRYTKLKLEDHKEYTINDIMEILL